MASDTRTIKVIVTGESSSAQRSIRDVGTASAQTAKQIDTANAAMRRSGTEANTASGHIGRLHSTMSSLGSYIGTAFSVAAGIGIAKLAGGIATLGVAATKMGVQTASGFQQADIAFTQMLGSGQEADRFLKQLQDFAKKTPFEFPDLVTASQRLMAMGIKAKDVIPTLTAVGDAVSAMGGGQVQIDRVTLAIGQMAAKGRVMGDELLQLTEAGIPAIKILAAQYGVSVVEMNKMITAGKVLSDDAIPKLVKGIEQGTSQTQAFGGMMSKQADTIQGRWSNLVDTLRTNLGTLFLKIAPQIEQGIKLATQALDGLFSGHKAGQTDIERIFANIHDFVVSTSETIRSIAIPAWHDLLGIASQVKAGWDALMKGAPANPATTPGQNAINAQHGPSPGPSSTSPEQNAINAQHGYEKPPETSGFVEALRKAHELLTKVRDTLSDVWQKVQPIVSNLKDQFAPTIDNLKKAWDQLTASFKGFDWAQYFRVLGVELAVFGALVVTALMVVAKVLEFVTGLLGPWIKHVMQVFDEFMDFLESVFKFFDDLFHGRWSKLWDDAIGILKAAWNLIWTTIKAGLDMVWNIVKGAWEMIVGIFQWVYDRLVGKSIIPDMVNGIIGWFRTLWNEVQQVFTWIRDKIETAMSMAQRAFENAKNGIKAAWDQLKSAAEEPVRFVVEHVYNEGIVRFWNAIAGPVGMGKLDAIHFATGGEIPTVPGINGDWIPFYGTAGEYVLNKRQVAALGGTRAIENAAGRPMSSVGGHYEGGGPLGWLANAGGWVAEQGSKLVKGALRTTLEPLISTIRSAIGIIPGRGGFLDLFRAVPTKLLDSILGWLSPKDVAPPPPSTGGSMDASVGAGTLGEWIEKAKQYVTIEWVQGLITLIMRESGGNPFAINLWDSNAAAGHPSQGLMQTIPGTFAAYRDPRLPNMIMDPVANIVAGMNYIHSRYGSLYNVQQAHADRPPMGYANGGWLNPGDLGYNETSEPEAVFTKAQLAAMSRPINVTVNVGGNVLAERDLATTIATAVRDEVNRLSARNGGSNGLK